MSNEDHESHGNSVAAWVSVAIMFIGFAVSSWAVVVSSTATFIAGGVIVVVGAIAWPVLYRMGFGDKNPPRSLYS